jgi:hypothetical protein
MLLLDPPHEILLALKCLILERNSLILRELAHFFLWKWAILFNELHHIIEVTHVFRQLKAKMVMLELFVVHECL